MAKKAKSPVQWRKPSRRCIELVFCKARALLALAHLSQRHPDALLGEAGQPLSFPLLPLETLNRREELRRIGLAIDHGECSFRNDCDFCSATFALDAVRPLREGGPRLLLYSLSYASVTAA
jgi:hypothetical protein